MHLLEIGMIWPNQTTFESLLIFERILDAATAAQTARTSPRELRRQLADRMRQGELNFDGRPCAPERERCRRCGRTSSSECSRR
jgi:hypothetical protein